MAGDVAANGGRPGGDGPNEVSALPWEALRGPSTAELLAAESFCDLYLVAGDPPERVPASRLLLAAASQPLARQLHLEAVEPGSEVTLPEVSAKAARAIVAFSCGLKRPFEDCSVMDARIAAVALGAGLRGLPAFTSKAEAAPVAAAPQRPVPVARRKRWWQVLVAAVVWVFTITAALTAYMPTATFNLQAGGFFMDDAMIQKNNVVTSAVLDWRRLVRTDFWGLDMFDPNTWTHKSFRPLVVLTFRWNFLLHGFASCGFHVTNALLHAVASFQLGWFGLHVLRLPWSWSAMLAALFAAHPVHTESICYIVCRADILCAQALFLATHVYFPCASGTCVGPLEAALRVVVATFLLVVAGLCKETGFCFFGLLVIWEVLGLVRGADSRTAARRRDGGSGAEHGGNAAGRWMRIVALLIFGGSACAWRVWYTAGTGIARMDPYSNPVAAEEDPAVRRLSYALVHGMYMKLLVWPSFLCYDYSMDAVPLVRSVQDVRLLLPMAAYLGLAQAACTAIRGLRGLHSAAAQKLASEGPALGVAIFLLSFLPMANILFPVGTLVAERLLYIPSIGVLCLAVSVAYLNTAASSSASGFARRGGKHPGRLVAVGITGLGTLAVWWVLCYRRVLDWRNVEQITLVDGLKQLRSSRTQFNLANIYLLGQRLDEALVAYQRANAADPLERDSQPLYHAGQILLYSARYTEAEVYLQKAVSGYFSPLTLHEEEVWHDYGLALWHVGRGAEAVHNFQNSIITNPAFPKGYNNLACGLVLLGLGGQPQSPALVQQGLQAMEQAITLTPSSPLYWKNAAALLTLAGDAQAAAGAWERYRQLDPHGAAVLQAAGGGALPRECSWEFYFR